MRKMNSSGDFATDSLSGALETARQELDYSNKSWSVECIVKDEEIRQLAMKRLVLKQINDDLIEQSQKNNRQHDRLTNKLSAVQDEVEHLSMATEQLEYENRKLKQENDILRTEISALQSLSSDTSKVVGEKLALEREISKLKPEVDHWRAQASDTEKLWHEKLTLEEQISKLKGELTGKTQLLSEKSEEVECRHAELRKVQDELATEKRKFDEVETLNRKICEDREADEKLKQQLQKELQEERLSHEKVKHELAELRNNALKRDTSETEIGQRVCRLEEDLESERKNREKAEEELALAKVTWESKKEALEEKLGAFRTKLRTTKDKLKDTQKSLDDEREKAAAVSKDKEKQLKRKRATANMEDTADITMGTPGMEQASKRCKRLTSANVGDKSTFSITPFLARVSNINGNEEADVCLIKPLAETTCSKINSTAQDGKISQLGSPNPECNDENNENTDQRPLDSKKARLIPKLKPSVAKPMKSTRKSLLTFNSFLQESPQLPTLVRPSRRNAKAARSVKTLFDDDNGDDARNGQDGDNSSLPSKPIPGRGLLLGKGFRSSIILQKSTRANVITASDGFQFSPLKRNKRNAGVSNV